MPGAIGTAYGLDLRITFARSTQTTDYAIVEAIPGCVFTMAVFAIGDHDYTYSFYLLKDSLILKSLWGIKSM